MSNRQWWMLCLVAQSCVCDSMDHSLSGFLLHGNFRQAYWEWLPCVPPQSRSSNPDQPRSQCHRQILYSLSYEGSPFNELGAGSLFISP